MSTADLVLIAFALLGAWSGYTEGFLMELFSLAAIVLGVFCAFKLMGAGMIFLEERFNADKGTLPYISFAMIFIVVVILVRFLGKVLSGSIDKTFLGTLDQALGAALGAFRALFMLSIVLWIIDSLKLSMKDSWTEGSWLYPFTAKLAPTVARWVGDLIPAFEDIFPVF